MKFLKKYFDILKYIYSFSHTYIFLILFVKIFNFFTTYAMLYLGRILLNSISRSISESKLEINRLIIVIFIVLIFEVLTTLFYNISQYFIGKIILRYNDALTIKMATQISSLDMSYFDNPEHYNKLRQASSVSNSIMNIFNGSIDLIFACFSLVFYFFICLKFNIFITLIALLSVIPGYIINKKIQVCNYDMEKSIIPNKRYVDYLLSIFYNRNTEMELKIYNFSDFIIRKVDNTQKEYRDKKIKFSRKAAIWESLLFVFNKVCYYCNSIFIILCIIKNKLTIGDYTYYNGIVLNLSSSLKSSINLINNIYINFIKYNDYCSILERKPLIDTSGNININTSKIEIEFYHVSFKYPNTDNWTLKDITFKFTSGDKIALVGLNGAGKSTLIKLLLRFYDPVEGDIFLNGINIKKYDLTSYRRIFSTMFQDIILYLLSIEDNICISDISCDNEKKRNKVQQITKELGIDVINEKPLNLERFYGKEFYSDGYILSKGQQQKLQAAKTLFRDANVFIFDEPAASLDAIAESKFLKTLVDSTKEKSVIYITHRYNNLDIMDNIILLNNGQIVEQGTHHILINNKGLYYKMFCIQNKKEIK